MDRHNVNEQLLAFVAACPSMFHTVATVAAKLDEAGFVRLSENRTWDLQRGGSYYVTRNGSSIIAFKIGAALDAYHFQICASHADSPTFKVKAMPELEGPDNSMRLNVEGYGHMIDYTWLDRPLSLAGRALVRTDIGAANKLVSFDRDLALIPSIAVHQNRDVNKGYAFNHQVDLCPLVSVGEVESGAIHNLIASELDVAPDDVLSYDLYLVNRQPGVIWGMNDEFVSSPKLDDLQGTFASLEGFIDAVNPHEVSVFVCFDNEEVGSSSKQGALSTFLRDVLTRINSAVEKDETDLLRALAGSFMVSVDNAHAIHPNHPELSDPVNHPQLNRGVVIKEHAAQKYVTDAYGRAVFSLICQAADVPTQTFANRSDMVGGSTLGNLSNHQVSLHGVDIGLPQLAMHSSYETAGASDTLWGIQALRAFYETTLMVCDCGFALC